MFVLDQLRGIDGIAALSMFGGVGLYANAVFFGIVYRDVLYLKVDDTTRGGYERAGMKSFKPYKDRPMTMQYYEVPLAVLESSDELTTWARHAIEATERKPAAKKRAAALRRTVAR